MQASLKRAKSYLDEIGPLKETLCEIAQSAGIKVDAHGNVSDELPGLSEIIARAVSTRARAAMRDPRATVARS